MSSGWRPRRPPQCLDQDQVSPRERIRRPSLGSATPAGSSTQSVRLVRTANPSSAQAIHLQGAGHAGASWSRISLWPLGAGRARPSASWPWRPEILPSYGRRCGPRATGHGGARRHGMKLAAGAHLPAPAGQEQLCRLRGQIHRRRLTGSLAVTEDFLDRSEGPSESGPQPGERENDDHRDPCYRGDPDIGDGAENRPKKSKCASWRHPPSPISSAKQSDRRSLSHFKTRMARTHAFSKAHKSQSPAVPGFSAAEAVRRLNPTG